MPAAKSLTELVAIAPERVDRVKSPASGFPVLIMKATAAKDVDRKGNVDEQPDVDGAEDILRSLARLIASEARELGAGNWQEICDIDMLCEAAHIMNCFRRTESYALSDSAMKELQAAVIQVRTGDGDVTAAKRLISEMAKELSVTSPAAESASKDAPEPTPSTDPASPVAKTTEEIVEAAVAKAIAPVLEDNQVLKAELAAFKAMPLPGGPFITNTAPAAVKSQDSDRLAYFERMAKSTADRELAAYYAERAADLRAS